VSTTLPGDGTLYRLVARHSGKVADVQSAGTANGTNVLQWPWLNQTNQKWTFAKTGDGYYKIKGVGSGKLLEVAGLSRDDGGNVGIWADATAPQQRPSHPPVTEATSSSTATAGSPSPSTRAAPPTEPTSSSSRTRHRPSNSGRSPPS
jgi:alpha-L-fucosidase